MTQHQIHLGQKLCSFSCELKPGNAKYKIKLLIHPQKGLIVRHARNTPLSEVKTFLLAHHEWIEKNLRHHVQVQPEVSFDQFSVPWLGKQQAVSFYPHKKNTITIEPSAEMLKIFLPAQWQTTLIHPTHPDFQEVKAKLKQALTIWYKKQASIIFPGLMKECMACCIWVKTMPTIRIKMQKSRWGSCSSLGNINLNAALLQFPEESIKNVIFHELCHLKHPNHSADFYRLLASVDANWQSHHVYLRKGNSVLFCKI